CVAGLAAGVCGSGVVLARLAAVVRVIAAAAGRGLVGLLLRGGAPVAGVGGGVAGPGALRLGAGRGTGAGPGLAAVLRGGVAGLGRAVLRGIADRLVFGGTLQ